MSFGKTLRLTACAVFLATSASATTITSQFSSFWVLGDSLSGPNIDPGTKDLVPRFTDGKFWSELIAQDFEDAEKPNGIAAIAGAAAGLNRGFDLVTQTAAIVGRSWEFGTRPLAAIWIGGNDILPIAADPAALFDAYNGYANAFTQLYAKGVRDFLVFEIPDAGSTPRFNGTPLQAGATGGATLLNSVFTTGAFVPSLKPEEGFIFLPGVQSIQPDDVNITKIDTFLLTQTAFKTPGFFGDLARGPCYMTDFMGGNVGPIPGTDCTKTTFWDGFHPTSPIHAFIADQVRMAYIPLPAAGWLLIAAMGGLVVMRRRA